MSAGTRVMADKIFDLVVVGELNPDLILGGKVVPEFGQVEKLVESAVLTIGSSSAIFACGAARLGLKVAFIGRVGRDEFGRFMRQGLEERGIDTRGLAEDPDAGSGLSVILSTGGDRAILTYPGTIPRLLFSDVNEAILASARHLHLGSYFIQQALRPDVPALFDLAHRQGLTVSLDTNYDPAEEWDGGLVEALRRVDVFLPNAAECCAIARLCNLQEAARSLARLAKLVAVKLGEQGAMLVTGERAIHTPSLPVQVVDTVGAGDSFDAGFIYGYLSGWELERALRLAAVCGALSARAAGGVAAQPTLKEAMAYL